MFNSPKAHQQNDPIEVPLAVLYSTVQLAQFMPDDDCGKPELKGSPTSGPAFRALMCCPSVHSVGVWLDTAC